MIATVKLVLSKGLGNIILAAYIVVPVLGCVLAVYFKSMAFLVLLTPLIIFMEGAFILGPVCFMIVDYLNTR